MLMYVFMCTQVLFAGEGSGNDDTELDQFSLFNGAQCGGRRSTPGHLQARVCSRGAADTSTHMHSLLHLILQCKLMIP